MIDSWECQKCGKYVEKTELSDWGAYLCPDCMKDEQ